MIYLSFSGQRVGSRRIDDSARLSSVHSFEVDAGDQDIGNADPNRVGREGTRVPTAEQEVQPKVDFGAVGICFGLKCYRGRLYNVALRFCLARFCLAKRQRLRRRTASARESFSANTRVGCRGFEGYSVSPAATHCGAAGQWILIATKHGSTSEGCSYP